MDSLGCDEVGRKPNCCYDRACVSFLCLLLLLHTPKRPLIALSLSNYTDYETFITEKDFMDIAAAGLNFVRM